MQLPAPAPVTLDRADQYRIVPSRFPPVDLFEAITDPETLEIVWAIEAMTNDRLREQAGDLGQVRCEDWVLGPGSTPVMAAFTHIGRPGRFNDASYGVYYAARELETAIAETRFHRERFMRSTGEAPMTLDQRVYRGEVRKPMLDVRAQPTYASLHDPHDYAPSQAFARPLKAADHWGLVYRSVRRPGGQCIAAFRPPAVSPARQIRHLAYVWDGEHIDQIYEKRWLSGRD